MHTVPDWPHPASTQHVCVCGRGAGGGDRGLPSVGLVSVFLSSDSLSAAPPSTSASLCACPTLYPKPASVETTEKQKYYDSIPGREELCRVDKEGEIKKVKGKSIKEGHSLKVGMLGVVEFM